MKVGQIVYINKEQSNVEHVTTGIILTKIWDEASEMYWYDVFGDDNKIYVLPAILLSSRPFTPFTWTKEMHKKRANSVHACTKPQSNQLNYIHNQTQKLKTFTHK